MKDQRYAKDENEVLNCCFFLQWYFQSPMKRFPFILFLAYVIASGILSFFYFRNKDKCYTIALIFAFTLALLGFFQFRGLKRSLQTHADKYLNLNCVLRSEIKFVGREVDRISVAIFTLANAQNRIQNSNDINRKNLQQFAEIQQALQSLNISQQMPMRNVLQKISNVQKSWKTLCMKYERSILVECFERVEKSLNMSKNGLNAEAYETFLILLPFYYRFKMNNLGCFLDIANKNELIDYKTFVGILDKYEKLETRESVSEFVNNDSGQPNSKSIDFCV